MKGRMVLMAGSACLMVSLMMGTSALILPGFAADLPATTQPEPPPAAQPDTSAAPGAAPDSAPGTATQPSTEAAPATPTAPPPSTTTSEAPAAAPAAEPPATAAYRKVMMDMHSAMMMTPSGVVDVDFAKSMIPHHQAAIDMAKAAKANARDSQVLAWADSIMQTQQQEITQLQQWLDKSASMKLEATPAAKQANDAVMQSMMQGMNVAYTGNADRDFVLAMIPHHQGAIDMAKVEQQYGKDDEMRKMADAIIATQEKEIADMKAWLDKNKP